MGATGAGIQGTQAILDVPTQEWSCNNTGASRSVLVDSIGGGDEELSRVGGGQRPPALDCARNTHSWLAATAHYGAVLDGSETCKFDWPEGESPSSIERDGEEVDIGHAR